MVLTHPGAFTFRMAGSRSPGYRFPISLSALRNPRIGRVRACERALALTNEPRHSSLFFFDLQHILIQFLKATNRIRLTSIERIRRCQSCYSHASSQVGVDPRLPMSSSRRTHHRCFEDIAAPSYICRHQQEMSEDRSKALFRHSLSQIRLCEPGLHRKL